MLKLVLVTAMVASSSISDRRKCWWSFLLMRFTSQSRMLSSFDDYALLWGSHLMVVSRYTSSESIMSSYVVLEVDKYEKTLHN